MFRSNFQEENVQKDSKLQAVFSKLSGVFPRAEDFGNSNKPMSSEIIESVLVDSPIPLATNWNYEAYAVSEDGGHHPLVATITQRLETELRRAKRTHLSCGEVLLPCGLLQRIAADVVSMAENEPCGLRGCGLRLYFERPEGCMSLGMLRCDPSTACTFELHLTLKQNNTRWTFLPQFLRNLTRGGTIVVSPAYTISKKKLYRTQSTE